MADARALTIQSGQMQELAIADSLLLSGIEIPDNTASALLISEGANAYLDITTTDGSELITVGGASNPDVLFAGTGLATFDGAAIQLTEQGSDPGVTPTNAGNLYTKDVSAVTELFYQDSAANIVQVTSGGSLVIAADIPISDNTANAFLVHEGARNYIDIDTVNTAERITFGDLVVPCSYTFNLKSTGTGEEFEILDRTGAINILTWSTSGGAWATTFGSNNVLTPIYSFWTRGSNSAAWVILDEGGGGDMMRMTNAGGVIFGNATASLPLKLLGTSTYLQLAEAGADPGATVNTGKAYTKDVSTITELFYQDSAGSVVQITSGGAVNSTATPGGADTQLQYNNAGVFGGAASATFDGTNITATNALFTDGGIDRSAAAALSIGVTNASAITIGSAAMTTTVAGALAANGDVDLGNAAADTISFTGEGDTDLTFVESVNRTISVSAETTVETVGASMTLTASAGGASGGAGAGGVGGSITIVGATGGAGDGTNAAGAGGQTFVTGGLGGTTGGAGGGAGGGITVAGGAGTTAEAGGDTTVIGGAGAGAGADGALNIGTSDTSIINLGNAASDPAINVATGGGINMTGDAFLGSADASAAAVSGASEGRLRYNNTAGAWQVSVQGAAYVDLATGGGTPGGADTQLQYNNAGVFGGTASATFDGTNITTTNAMFTNGGIDRSAAATLSIGVTNANAITIGQVGVTTTIAGDLQVDGAETVTGTSTFVDSATFNGNVIFGNAATDTVQFGASDATGSRVGPAGSPNMHFVKEVNHTINIDASTTNTTDGGTLSIASGDGTVASGAGNNAGNGGPLNTSAGGGGASIGTDNAGIGGSYNITSGFGGAGSATNVGGNSGNLTIDVGAPGASGGAGAGTGGQMSFGETNATSVTIGNAATQAITLDGTVLITMPDDSAGALSISEGATDYIQIITTNGSEQVIIGTTATQTITLDGTALVTIPDNSAGALVIAQGAVDYLRVVTTNAGESIEYGNASTNPAHNFLGTGAVTVDGAALLLTEQAGDPTTAANEGGIYTKDDGGVTQLFYRADSDGTVYQLTPASTGNATDVVTTKTASENIAAGAPVNIFNSGGVPRIREADANDAARQRVVGLAAAAILSAAAGDVVTQGEVPVPDAQWDAVPAVGDVGSPVYLSTTVGNLTITAPSGAVTVVDLGTVSTGGTGAVTVLVNVKMPVKTI